jgi:tetratricopeptide (TPR) repeat protein
VSDDKLQKKLPSTLKEKGQYFLAFGVIAAMLLVAQIPLFVILFFGIFAFFLWKIFSAGSRNETREVFEFYLSANEMLRDDERRWYGFEMQDTIARGEHVLQSMSGAPPLVYFGLGALYHKIGDHKAAVTNLAHVLENENADESHYIYPTPELRNYVRILRKIEREPAEAPLTSAAIRALERARRNRGKAMLEDSRRRIEDANRRHGELAENKQAPLGLVDAVFDSPSEQIKDVEVVSVSGTNGKRPLDRPLNAVFEEDKRANKRAKKKQEEDPFTNRQTISEVLHDIYDKNIQ